MIVCLYVCVEGFKAQSTQWGHVERGSVYLTTRLLGRLSPLSGSFTGNWQLLFLNQWKGENDRRNDLSPRKNVADLGGGWTRDLLVSSRTAHPTEPPRPTLYDRKKKSINFRNLLPDLASRFTLSGSNYPYLEQISMVPKRFELLRFDSGSLPWFCLIPTETPQHHESNVW